MLQDGNRVIVRSVATGTPKGDFMGLRSVHHLEDWATAMRQLKG